MYFPLNPIKVPLAETGELFSISSTRRFLPRPHNLARKSRGSQIPTYHGGAEMFIGQPCVAHFRVASHCLFLPYSPWPPWSPWGSWGQTKAFGCQFPALHLFSLARSFHLPLPGNYTDPVPSTGPDMVLMDTELPEGKGSISLILSS